MFWYGLLCIKDVFLNHCKFHVGNSDWWLGCKPLKLQFPDLFEICFNKNISVDDVVTNRGRNVCFRRTLKCDQVRLNGANDKLWWIPTENGKFTVSSFYKKLK
ncbi:hypothetical protein BRADI_1g27338v3 [Brachypodium distachyon]|uniref:Uncharacterized protein n=1 Tax=Brachypodium distachyon TaxID=15368 RepID=A0A2K2DLA9_BRADI|nr:hypothetical protein BRADI_1g27338v3 [Brachypodium distachyon]